MNGILQNSFESNEPLEDILCLFMKYTNQTLGNKDLIVKESLVDT
jgi:hypothetical protein